MITSEYITLARSVAAALSAVITELNAKEASRLETLLVDLEASSENAGVDPFERYVVADRARTSVHEVAVILLDTAYLARAMLVVSAHRIETIRGLLVRLRAMEPIVETELLSILDKLFETVRTLTMTVEQLREKAEKYPTAIALVAKSMKQRDAISFVQQWAEKNLGPPSLAVPSHDANGMVAEILPNIPGPRAIFDCRAMLDRAFMAEHGYDKLTEFAGVSEETIRRARTIVFLDAAPSSTATTEKDIRTEAKIEAEKMKLPFTIWTPIEVVEQYRVSEWTADIAIQNNKPRMTFAALEELQTRNAAVQRMAREQHRGVQRTRIYTLKNPLDVVLVESLKDVWRFKEVSQYYENLVRMRKPARVIASQLLEHKEFSGTDMALCDLYEKAVSVNEQ